MGLILSNANGLLPIFAGLQLIKQKHAKTQWFIAKNGWKRFKTFSFVMSRKSLAKAILNTCSSKSSLRYAFKTFTGTSCHTSWQDCVHFLALGPFWRRSLADLWPILGQVDPILTSGRDHVGRHWGLKTLMLAIVGAVQRSCRRPHRIFGHLEKTSSTWGSRTKKGVPPPPS